MLDLDYWEMTNVQIVQNVACSALLFGTVIGMFIIGMVVTTNSLLNWGMDMTIIVKVVWASSVVVGFCAFGITAAQDKGWINWKWLEAS